MKLLPILISAFAGFTLTAEALAPVFQASLNDTLVSPGGPQFNLLGSRVAVSGNLLAATAPFAAAGYGNLGAVRVFDAATGNQRYRLTRPDGVASNASFAEGLALEGNLLLVTASGNSSGHGALFVFDATTGRHLRRIAAADGGNFTIGRDVVLSGRLAVVSDYNFAGCHVFDVLTGEHLRTLLPDSGPGSSFFGRSLAADGGRIAVGSLGAVYLFDAATGAQLQKLTPADGTQDATGHTNYGNSVALDANWLAVGASQRDGSLADTGAVYLTNFTTGDTKVITPPQFAQKGEMMGTSVALSGGYLFAGAPQNGTNTPARDGAVYVFDAATGGWADYFQGRDGEAGDRLGGSLAVSAGLLVTGASGHDTSSDNVETQEGMVYLFGWGRLYLGETYNGSFGWQRRMGFSVAARSGDFLAGAPVSGDGSNDKAGTAQWWDSSPVATKVLTAPAPVQSNARAGTAVGCSALLLAAGSPLHDGAHISEGRVLIYEGSPPVYKRSLVPTAPAFDDRLGSSVAVSGNKVLAGAVYRDVTKNGVSYNQAGAAYLFNGSTGAQLRMFTAPSPSDVATFGASTAIAEWVAGSTPVSIVAIGSPQWRPAGGEFARGSVDLFNGLNGSHMTTLTVPGSGGDQFGAAIALVPGVLAIGAPNASAAGGVRSGAVHVYLKNQLTPAYRLTPPVPETDAFFGSALATDGTLLLVGAWGEDGVKPNAGAVYVYRAADGMLLRRITLHLNYWKSFLGSDITSVEDGWLGYSLAISGGRVYAGAPNKDEGDPYNVNEGLGGVMEFDVSDLLADPALFPDNAPSLQILQLLRTGTNAADSVLAVQVTAGDLFHLQTSTGNLSTWTDLQTNLTGQGSIQFLAHPGGADDGKRFYRLKRP